MKRLNYVRVNIGNGRSHVVPVPKEAVPGQKIFFEISGGADQQGGVVKSS